MALIEDQEHATNRPRFCPECGHAAGDGTFCPGCGAPLASGVYEYATPPPDQPTQTMAPPEKHDHTTRNVLIAAGVLGAVAIAVAVIIVISTSSSSSSNNTQAGYRAKLTAALAPLIAANQSLSNSLQALDGSKTTVSAAQRTTVLTQQALVSTRGAVGVLTAPSSDSTLSQQVQQALTDENGYLQAVSSTLGNPGTSTQVRALATGAQSALVPLAVVAPGAPSSLTGSDNLISWAQGAAAAAAAAAAKNAKQASASGNSSSGSSGSSSGSSGSSGGSSANVSGSTDCGGGIIAGPNTSCPFAQNVHEAWLGAPGDTNTLQVYSPVTNQTYTMNCAPAGAGITCSGANNASVSW
jgi:hypothetical protein